MSLVCLPSYESFWSTEFQYSAVADVMSLKRYECLTKCLHAVDNTTKNEHSGKLFKVKPVSDAVHNDCIKIEQERDQSADEQIIPDKTKHSGIRQYMPKKNPQMGF